MHTATEIIGFCVVFCAFLYFIYKMAELGGGESSTAEQLRALDEVFPAPRWQVPVEMCQPKEEEPKQ